MTEPRNRILWQVGWLSSALILAAYGLFSPLSLLAVNAPRGASPVKFFVIAGGAFLLACALVAILARRMTLHRATGIGAVVLFVFFSWTALRALGEEVSASPVVAGVLVPVVVLAVLVWASVRFGDAQVFRVVVMTMGVALVATPLPSLVSWYAADAISLAVPELEPSDASGPHPDVYFVILDGYGRADVLEETYGYSNKDFLDEMIDHGFVVPEAATSNYSMTAASVASTLAMSYLVDPGVVPDHPLRLALYQIIRGGNPVVASLTDLGYQNVHIESGWDGSRCGPNVDICYPAGFLDEASWTLLNRTPLSAPLEQWFGHAFAQNGLRALDDLTRVAQVGSETPRFVFAHVLLPHPPLNVDGRCRVRPEPQPGGGAVGARFLLDTPAWEDRKAGYVEQIQCVNTKILRFLDDLGDDSVVFITGDHGPDGYGQVAVPPGEWTDADRFERFGVFSAYRLPAGCEQVKQDVDLINGMRLLVGCATGEELEPLPPRHLIFPTPDGDPYPTTEVELVTLNGG